MIARFTLVLKAEPHAIVGEGAQLSSGRVVIERGALAATTFARLESALATHADCSIVWVDEPNQIQPGKARES